MNENEQKARTIKNALSAEDDLLEEIYHAENGNRPELYQQLNDLRKERHNLISDFYPTACPEPLHRAVSLMKEENMLESLFMKALESQNYTSNLNLNMGTASDKADEIEKRLKNIREMRDQAILETSECSVPAKSKDNRCYECEAREGKQEEILGLFDKLIKARKGKPTEATAKRQTPTKKKILPPPVQAAKKTKNLFQKKSFTKTGTEKNNYTDKEMWNNVLWSLLS